MEKLLLDKLREEKKSKQKTISEPAAVEPKEWKEGDKASKHMDRILRREEDLYKERYFLFI